MRYRLAAVAPLALALVAGRATAQNVVSPGDGGGPFCLSPAFGMAACSLSDEYLSMNLRFHNTSAVFQDGVPLAWGGINGAGVVDLVSPVMSSFWSTNGLSRMFTSFVSVEAGFAAPGTLLLEVFGVDGTLLASRLNGADGLGPNGRTLINIFAAGIHSWRVSGNDSFGVDQVEFADLSAVPEPTTMILLASGLGAMAAARRRRREAAPLQEA